MLAVSRHYSFEICITVCFEAGSYRVMKGNEMK